MGLTQQQRWYEARGKRIEDLKRRIMRWEREIEIAHEEIAELEEEQAAAWD